MQEGGAGSVMCAYNRVSGTYACEHPLLLNDVLKREWGFDGWVMSDWGATHSAKEAALAGLDQEQHAFELATHYRNGAEVGGGVGQVPSSPLDDMVLRILRPAFRHGLFDGEPPRSPPPSARTSRRPSSQKTRRGGRGRAACC